MTAKFSVEEYLAIDRSAEVPSEFHDGELFPIETASPRHARLSVKLSVAIEPRLGGSTCRLVSNSIRVRVSPTKFLVPDLTVYCGEPVLTDEHQDTLTNPKVIIEILSPSTNDYDYGEKFWLYRRLPSFVEYVLVSQSELCVEVFRLTPDHRWMLSTYQGLDAVFAIESLGITIPLSDIYGD